MLERMLDLRALVHQLDAMTADLGLQAQETDGRLARALGLLDRAAGAAPALGSQLEAFRAIEDAPWPLPTPLGLLDAVAPLPPVPARFTVIATDGSQIAPSHHELALCYVLNVGRILYTYGTGEAPLQDSLPRLFHRDDAMRVTVGRRRVGVGEELVAAARQAEEALALVGLADLAQGRGHPTLALVDGSLIQWPLEQTPDAFREARLAEHLRVFDAMRERGIPMAGYISHSRAFEVTNLLRLVSCPRSALVCDTCAWEAPPCEAHLPLGDRKLWEARLAVGERSPVFASHSPILARYGPHRVCFFYLHVGSEVARIEVPAWVAESPAWLHQVHALCVDQARKGQGYPIALQEAHNQAVVNREDRERFFALVAQRLARAGVKVAVSNKQLKKRMGAV